MFSGTALERLNPFNFIKDRSSIAGVSDSIELDSAYRSAKLKIDEPESDGLRVVDLMKTYTLGESEVEVLRGINLHVEAKKFVSIVGASGCGKSTLLRLIVGLDNEYEGNIYWKGAEVTGTSLDRGIVFQEHRLLPWLTVKENVALALDSNGLSATALDEIVWRHLRLVGLEAFANAYPSQISGGMSQRVAIARALVVNPSLLLLDEPFGALDALTRLKMQQELELIWRSHGTTSILVTHDVEEAVFLSDLVVVMASKPGEIKRIVEVDLERPRIRKSEKFQEIKEDILSDFI